MPTSKNWFNFIFVNLGFIAFIFAVYITSALQDIKKNWPIYRCNPIYMPLADNVEENFAYCIQNIQTNFIGYLLQPINAAIAQTSDITAGLADDVNSCRGMFNNVRFNMGNIFGSIFGIFMNLTIEIQKIIMNIKDMLNKTMSVVVTMLYILEGSIQAQQSMWTGPPGALIRSLGKA